MSDGMKQFFSTWYGKIVLACMTALAVGITIAVARVPLNDRAEILRSIAANQSEIVRIKAEYVQAGERLTRMETNIEWLVKALGGDPK